MTFNLRKEAKVGATAYFICGGSAVIDNVVETGGDLYPVGIEFKGCEDTREYYMESGCYKFGEDSPFDIIRIEPAPFDWDDVRQGMAFEHEERDGIFYYLANIWWKSHLVYMVKGEGCSPRVYSKNLLTRAPEHDLDLEVNL